MKMTVFISLCLLVVQGFADETFLSSKNVIDKTISKIQNSRISENYYSCLSTEDTNSDIYDNFSTIDEFGNVEFQDLSNMSVAKYAILFHNSLPVHCGFGYMNLIKRKAMREILNANNFDKLGNLNWD